ncbi:MAG: hypothetical protein PHX93_01465 [Candidatus Peribacteraceae bacterium]|jgi:hypothetical protein|nr:hypothetical protein [Candidatus Peribacteraceae bacterium]
MRLSLAFITCAAGILTCCPKVCAQGFIVDYQSVQGKTGMLSTSQFFVEGGMVSLQGTGNGTTIQTSTPGTGAMCGDNIREDNEECDGSDVGSVSCQSLGFAHGNILCTDQCVIDSSGCSAEEGSEKEQSQNTDGGVLNVQPESPNATIGGHRGSNAQTVTATPVSEPQTQPSFHVEETIELATETDFLLPPQNTTLEQETKPLPAQNALTSIRKKSSGIPVDQPPPSSVIRLSGQASDAAETKTQKPSGSVLASLLVQLTPSASTILEIAIVSLAALLIQLLWAHSHATGAVSVRSAALRNRRARRSSIRIAPDHKKNKPRSVPRSRIYT